VYVHSFGPLELTNVTGVYSNMTPAWLFESAADAWSAWLPSEALETVRRGGFYSVLQQPGFRIIALNSNLCYVLNW
jgi:sphingomyelin phosphodiesterase